MSSEAKAPVAAYIQLVHDNFMINLSAAAATAWLVYEIIITMDREIKFTWRSRWTIPKCLYIIVRYFTLVNMIMYLVGELSHVNDTASTWTYYCESSQYKYECPISGEFARILASRRSPVTPGTLVVNASTGDFIGSCPVLTSIFAEALLVIRLYALYHGRWKAIALVGTLYLAETTMSIVSAVLTLKPLPLSPNVLGLPGCSYSHESPDPEMLRLAIGSWTLVAFVTFMYFLLTLINFIVTLYPKGLPDKLLELHNLPRLAPILYLFVRDGTVYFFIVFVAALLTITLTAAFPSRAISAMGYLWLTVTYSVMSARLYLNLRGAMVSNQTTVGLLPEFLELHVYNSTAVSDVAFAPVAAQAVSMASENAV
ncbi:hypothetical protein NEOLEDRAFT_1174735 [Neolentinus lepideus HHB14362 ss-1]|uniref:DUF6533 domain-containing protein n=1 Tax=Neolentinus lepideus HHB14362 ss-1 TaxID=1314782 RepID=A0A165VIL7_9AGAM|nr:hypothetical protein NEOLEDRAFT_1174735 [Neolentinus lepideus HHB14362 ss-1]